MGNNCSTIVFSNRAYNAIIRESFKKDPMETGGILLGHIVDGIWVVMEVLSPGIHCIFKVAYFEYDTDFVNYLADSVASQYEYPLELLGLWHRHPGSLDTFSGTDDVTNTTFALQNKNGVISGIVNIDPSFRLTMYHLDNPKQMGVSRPSYERVDIEVGDDIIPSYFFNIKFVNSEKKNLHPSLKANEPKPKDTNSTTERTNGSSTYNGDLIVTQIHRIDLPPRTDNVTNRVPSKPTFTYSVWKHIYEFFTSFKSKNN